MGKSDGKSGKGKKGLTREERREINSLLLDLEEINLSGNDFDYSGVQTQIQGVEGLLGSYGVVSSSEYYKRLGNVRGVVEGFSKVDSGNSSQEEIIDENVQEETIDERIQEEKRSYAGSIGNNFLVVNPEKDFVYISQFYQRKEKGHKIKLNWRFNREGRLESITSSFIPECKYGSIMIFQEALEPDRGNEDWSNAVFEYFSLDKKFDELSKRFAGFDDEFRYRSLVLFGHCNTWSILKSMRDGSIIDPFYLNEGQKSLKSIGEDSVAVSILEHACLIKPRVSLCLGDRNLGLLTINYRDR